MIAAVLPLELIVEGFLQLLESLKGPSTVSRGMIRVGSHLEIVGQDLFDPIVRRSPMFVAPREPVIHAALLRFTCGFPGLCLAEFVHQGFYDLFLQGSAFLPPTLDHAFPDFSVRRNIEVVHSIIRPSFQRRESAKAYLCGGGGSGCSGPFDFELAVAVLVSEKQRVWVHERWLTDSFFFISSSSV